MTTTTTLAEKVALWFARLEGSLWLLADEADVKRALGQRDAPVRQPSDLRWSPEGRRLACVIGEVVSLNEGEGRGETVVLAESSVARVRLWSPKKIGVRGALGKNDVVSADFAMDASLVTLRDDGAIEAGGRVRARIPSARLVRACPRARTLAIVVERDMRSELHLLDFDGHTLAHVEGGPPWGGVAWSPDGSELAFRTARAIEILDARGTRLRAIDLSPLPACDPQMALGNLPRGEGDAQSGRLAWTPRGIVGLHHGWMFHANGDEVRALAPGSLALSLAASPDGRYVAIARAGRDDGITIVDVETGEHASPKWSTQIRVETPISFSPSGHALVYASDAGGLTIVPFGEPAIDPATGRVGDPQRVHLDHLTTFVRGEPGVRAEAESAADARVREVIEEIRRTPFRESLRAEASALASALEARLRDRMRSTATKAIYRESAPPAAYAIGDAVKHAKFGDGTVTAVEGSGETAKITVAFADAARSMRPSFLTRADR